MTGLSGESWSLVAALAWAGAVLLNKRAGDTIPPVALNLFKNTISLGLLFLTLPLAGESIRWPDDPAGFALLLTSGVLGVAVADTVAFRSLNLLGASRSAIVDCLYAPFVVTFSALLLDERLTWLSGVGALGIGAGIVVAGLDRRGAAGPTRSLVEGAVLGALAMALMAIAIVLVKPVLATQSVLVATTWRMLAGTVSLAAATLAVPSWRHAARAVFTPNPAWRFALPASVLGAYLALIAWMAGTKYTQAMTASILNQTSTLFVVVLAAIFLREPLTRRKAAAVALGFAGSVLVLI